MMHALSKTQPRAVSPVNKQREEADDTGGATATGESDQAPGIRQTMSGGTQSYLSPSPEANRDSEIQRTRSNKRLSRLSLPAKNIVKLIAPPGRRSSLTLRSPSVEHKTRQKLSRGEEASPPVEWLWERPDYGSPSGKSLSGIEQAKRPIRSVETIERTTLTVSPFTNGIGNSASVGQAAPGKKPEPEPFRLEEFKVGEISNTVLMDELPVEIRLGDSLEQTTLIPSPSENGSNKSASVGQVNLGEEAEPKLIRLATLPIRQTFHAVSTQALPIESKDLGNSDAPENTGTPNALQSKDAKVSPLNI